MVPVSAAPFVLLPATAGVLQRAAPASPERWVPERLVAPLACCSHYDANKRLLMSCENIKHFQLTNARENEIARRFDRAIALRCSVTSSIPLLMVSSSGTRS